MISTQLDLWPYEVSRIPWCGTSPRDLTRGAKVLILQREPGCMSAATDPAQCEMLSEKTARRYSGAPLLLSFDGRSHEWQR